MNYLKIVSLAFCGILVGGCSSPVGINPTGTFTPTPSVASPSRSTDGDTRLAFKRVVDTSLVELNSGNVNGQWFYGSQPLNGPDASVLLDNYGSNLGCAIWFYETENDADSALKNGFVNLFSSFYQQWTISTGESLIVVADSPDLLCYADALQRLNLQQSTPRFYDAGPTRLELAEEWAKTVKITSVGEAFLQRRIDLEIESAPFPYSQDFYDDDWISFILTLEPGGVPMSERGSVSGYGLGQTNFQASTTVDPSMFRAHELYLVEISYSSFSSDGQEMLAPLATIEAPLVAWDIGSPADFAISTGTGEFTSLDELESAIQSSGLCSSQRRIFYSGSMSISCSGSDFLPFNFSTDAILGVDFVLQRAQQRGANGLQDFDACLFGAGWAACFETNSEEVDSMIELIGDINLNWSWALVPGLESSSETWIQR